MKKKMIGLGLFFGVTGCLMAAEPKPVFEADFHENFNNDCVSAGGGHSYAACLETDADGNFYFVKCAEDTPHGGAVLRVTKDVRFFFRLGHEYIVIPPYESLTIFRH